MPIGKPIAFTGDIRKIDPNAYGFFYCEITTPNELNNPLLQRRIKTSEGMRTIAGLGSWTGWICSTPQRGEMDNAMKYGYQFNILNGYQFEQGNIFEEYVMKMYNLRLQYPKGEAMNLIAKLLMNSLYGKFGMKLENTIVEMYDTSIDSELDLFKDVLDVYGKTLQDFIKIDDIYITIRNSLISLKYNDEEDMYHGLDVNIAIASAITGGARMWMSVLKNNPLFNLYYSDTDSVVIDKELPQFMVGDGLGQLKLESVVKRAVFLAPKVYALITLDNLEIVKVKGLKEDVLTDIHIQDSSKDIIQTKWFKKVIEGEITVSDVAYNLKATSNKRAPIYIDGVFENTKPFNYEDIIKK